MRAAIRSALGLIAMLVAGCTLHSGGACPHNVPQTQPCRQCTAKLREARQHFFRTDPQIAVETREGSGQR